MDKRRKYQVLPSIRRCNQSAYFPHNYTMLQSRIYSNGLPDNFLPLSIATVGKTRYGGLHSAIRHGHIEGCIYRNNEFEKWSYGIQKKDIKLKPRPTVAGRRAKKALAKLQLAGLEDETYITLNKAATLISYHFDILKVAVDRCSLLVELPTPEDKITMKIHPGTRYIVKVVEVKTWLQGLISGEITSHSRVRVYDQSSKEQSRRKRIKSRQVYQDKQIARYGKNWRECVNRQKYTGKKRYHPNDEG